VRIHLDHQLKRKWRKTTWAIGLRSATQQDPEVAAFFKRLRSGSSGGSNLRVLLKQRVVYATVLKSASSRIRRSLCLIAGMRSHSLNPWRWHKIGSPPPLKSIPPAAFYRLARDPSALRFSFVRNPYDRLVSCWADKFQDQPLVPSKLFTKGNRSIDRYLDMRAEIDAKLPHGADKTLSFPDFVTFATAYGHRGSDGHIAAQSMALDLPGIDLDFIGKVETFEQDFNRVLDHMNADEEMRRIAIGRVNPSERRGANEYYTQELADRVYRAYQSDFDQFGYPRTLQS
jgi:hypothetical protein